MSGEAANLLNELSPLKRLALSYAQPRAREATLAVLALDERFAAMLRARKEPIATQLRLAWWREMLERRPAEWPQGDPVLDTLRAWRDPSDLAALAGGWESLLADGLAPEVIAEFAAGRGRAFACLALELGEESDVAAKAAKVWALADLAAHLSSRTERELVAAHGRRLPPPPALPPALRPLAVLAGLGARALDRGGSNLLDGPGSALLALRIGLTGR